MWWVCSPASRRTQYPLGLRGAVLGTTTAFSGRLRTSSNPAVFGFAAHDAKNNLGSVLIGVPSGAFTITDCGSFRMTNSSSTPSMVPNVVTT